MLGLRSTYSGIDLCLAATLECVTPRNDQELVHESCHDHRDVPTINFVPTYRVVFRKARKSVFNFPGPMIYRNPELDPISIHLTGLEYLDRPHRR